VGDDGDLNIPRSMSTAQRLAFRADLLDFTADPGLADTAPAGIRWRPDHWLMVEQGRIVGAQAASAGAPGDDWRRIEHPGRVLMPGFIDSHVHSAQVDVIGAWGTELLDWLQTHTFPAELRMADPVHALQMSQLFLHALVSHGTTSACIFPTVHAASVEALFEAAKARHMRVIAGKVLMDRHAPQALCDDEPQVTAAITVDLVERWHGQGRIAYAITPRFAVTSSEAQLRQARQLLGMAPDLYVQTHVAETQAECRWVAELFPQARSYLDVYDHHGLLVPRTVLAHGIWLDDADLAVLKERGGHIAFCPTSNQFLGSGSFAWHRTRAAGVPVSLASDVGGGTGLSMRRTMLGAYQVQAGLHQRVTAWALLHAATRGAAQALHLDHEIGGLAEGQMADLCVWDWGTHPLALRRQSVARDLHDRLFAWITSGDEADLAETWVAGVRQYARTA
jgi:guanine deaminase